MMVDVIVNADDYAYDENRTRAILEAWRLGAITQTTVLVNYPVFDEAVQAAKDSGIFPYIGLHLNLTRGVPLTNPIRRSRLFCDECGEFNGGAWRKRMAGRFFLPRYERNAVAQEARAQMEKYLSVGFPLRHLDSHHHVHTDWSVARIVLPLARQMGFRTARLSSNVGQMSVGKRLYKKLFNTYLRKTVGATVDYFGAFGAVSSCVQKLPESARVEVMVHPLYGTLDNLTLDGSLTDSGLPIVKEMTFWREHASLFRLEGR